MLSSSVDELLKSEMFKGTKAYGHSYDTGIRLKPWYGFLYIAKFATRDKLKIGITSDLEQRDQQLKNKTDKQEPSQIIYCWSMPTNEEIESKVKKLLFFFTKRDGNESGRTEIFFDIPLYPFILIVRLVILYIFIKKRYISNLTENDLKMQTILESYLDSLRIDSVKYGSVTYHKIVQFESDKRIAEIFRVVNELNDIFVNYNEEGTKIAGYYQADVQNEIDAARKITNSDEEWFKKTPTKAAQRYTWIKKWLETFTIMEDNVRKPKKETVALTEDEKDEKRRDTFVNGDLVTVIYPKEEGEYAGIWHARVISFKPKGPNQSEDGYFVEWLEKTPAGTDWGNTTVPAKWVRRDNIINRTLDILAIYKELELEPDIQITSTLDGASINSATLSLGLNLKI